MINTVYRTVSCWDVLGDRRSQLFSRSHSETTENESNSVCGEVAVAARLTLRPTAPAAVARAAPAAVAIRLRLLGMDADESREAVAVREAVVSGRIGFATRRRTRHPSTNECIMCSA